jgi:hypothetical protein
VEFFSTHAAFCGQEGRGPEGWWVVAIIKETGGVSRLAIEMLKNNFVMLQISYKEKIKCISNYRICFPSLYWA